MEIWNTESYTITYGDQTEYFNQPITVSDIMEFAKSVGLTSFLVKSSDGKMLSKGDFPYAGDIVLEKFVKVG